VPVTLRELAKAAGVSVSTVSRALTKSRHPVKKEVRRNIARLAEELGYRPNAVARSLRTNRTFTVGVIADDISSPFTPIIIHGIQDQLRREGYFSIIISTDWKPQAEVQAIDDLISRAVDGVIFVESWYRTSNEALDLAKKPYVFVHRLFQASYRYSVIPDEQYGASLAVGHLLGLGHRNIGFISGPRDFYSSTDRLVGYQNELNQVGVPFRPEYVEVGTWEIGSGYEATQRLLKASPNPTAIFATNDMMALGAIHAIQDVGLHVPDDVAVVGYDDRTIAAMARPTITTVSLPCYEMGVVSARLLLRLLNGLAIDTEEIKVKGKLIVRQSCGAKEGRQTLPEMYFSLSPRRASPR